MTFADFCGHLAKIEATPKRLEITSILSKLLKQAPPNQVDKVVMLALGRLAPLYKDIDFGLAEKTIIRSLASAYNLEAKTVIENFKKAGDLGIVAGELKLTRHCEERSDLPRRQAGEAIPTRLPLPASSGLRGTRNDGKREARKSEISVSNVYQSLLKIATQIGEGSQEKKINKTADLLRGLDPLGAKYAVRIILGNLRLGFSDKTVLDALSVMIAGDKSVREKLEAAYNVRPDIGWLAKQVKSEKLKVKSLEDVKPQLGTPILPALCQRLPSTNEVIKKMDAVAVEPKWDGQRIQAHLSLNPKSEIRNPAYASRSPSGTIRSRLTGRFSAGRQKSEIAEVNLFTRSLEDVTEMFPDLVQALGQLTTHNSQPTTMILDGEAVAIDPKTGRVLPFQTMITRKRKYGIAEKLADVPVKYMVFDILYLNGKSLMNEEFTVRRQTLERSLLGVRQGDSSSGDIVQLAPQLVTSDAAEIRKFLKRQIDSGLEGIVAKRLDAAYIPGRTQFAWVKLKWEGEAKTGGLLDTVDCVVMGTYAGRGKRAGFGVGAFLVGIAANSMRQVTRRANRQPSAISHEPRATSYLTISKIGTGLTDRQWRELKVKSQKLKVKSQPKEYEVPKELTPDAWLRPELVAEIQADNITKSPLHSAGYALRFPRLVRYRNDKNPDQATTLEEIKKLYQMSLKH